MRTTGDPGGDDTPMARCSVATPAGKSLEMPPRDTNVISSPACSNFREAHSVSRIVPPRTIGHLKRARSPSSQAETTGSCVHTSIACLLTFLSEDGISTSVPIRSSITGSCTSRRIEDNSRVGVWTHATAKTVRSPTTVLRMITRANDPRLTRAADALILQPKVTRPRRRRVQAQS
jgi:hypothetical protein